MSPWRAVLERECVGFVVEDVGCWMLWRDVLTFDIDEGFTRYGYFTVESAK